jgi:hypothetical protein
MGEPIEHCRHMALQAPRVTPVQCAALVASIDQPSQLAD